MLVSQHQHDPHMPFPAVLNEDKKVCPDSGTLEEEGFCYNILSRSLLGVCVLTGTVGS